MSESQVDPAVGEFVHPPVLLMHLTAGMRAAIAETGVVVGRQLWAVFAFTTVPHSHASHVYPNTVSRYGGPAEELRRFLQE